MSEPMSLHPADLAVLSLNSVLDRQGLWIARIECRLPGQPNSFGVVRIHPLHGLLDNRLILNNTENFLKPRIA
jgi:hypothetical protein